MGDLMRRGSELSVRSYQIKEIRNRITVLERPTERCLFIPGRQNNIFAAIAETFWVLAGRSDVAWLQTYLRRAAEFSDDGVKWRAGYGPRLRDWHGVDQLEQVRRLFLAELATRRAVMALYDPAEDFTESKDIPCNNWLHWLVRENKLHLNVAVRSNDVVWGFSGVNSFEWSVLHQMMAHWIGVEVGDVSYLASSFHIYERHYQTAIDSVSAYSGITCYDFDVLPVSFDLPWEQFDSALELWFQLEGQMKLNPDTFLDCSHYFSDPFFASALNMLRIYQGSRGGWHLARIAEELARLPCNDFTAAAYEFFGRKRPELFNDIPQPNIRAFFEAYQRRCPNHRPSGISRHLKIFVKRLHKRKSNAYGNSWKRRGEMTSILANIARKVDRLEQYNIHGSLMPDESIFDTAVDLLVYLIKYRLFLLERHGFQHPLPADAPIPLSDHVVNFDAVLDSLELDPSEVVTDSVLINHIILEFDELVTAAQLQKSLDEKLHLVVLLSKLAISLAAKLNNQPNNLSSDCPI